MSPLVYWATERESIRRKREMGSAPPWTADPILANYRFCNLRREDDRVTRWVFENWLAPNEQNPDLWFASAVARYLNKPETLQAIGFPVPWEPARVLEALAGRRGSGEKLFSAAYMISSKVKGVEKYVYLVESVWNSLWAQREFLRPRLAEPLVEFHQRLTGVYGVGGFMGAQIIADAKHFGILRSAPDWWDFAASGPGSRKGLNLLLGRPAKAPWKEEDWCAELQKLRTALTPEFEANGLPRLDAQNFQNALCEVSKYLRAKSGEGRPKQRYKGGLPTVFNT